MRDGVIFPMRLLVIEMLERSHVLSSEPERDEGITVIDGVQISAVKELLDVMLDDWNLSHCCIVRSSGWKICARPKGEYIFILSVLEGVRIYIDKSIFVNERRVEKFLSWF